MRAVLTRWPQGVVDLKVDGYPTTRFRPDQRDDVERLVAGFRRQGAVIEETVR